MYSISRSLNLLRPGSLASYCLVTQLNAQLRLRPRYSSSVADSEVEAVEAHASQLRRSYLYGSSVSKRALARAHNACVA